MIKLKVVRMEKFHPIAVITDLQALTAVPTTHQAPTAVKTDQ